MVVAFVWNCLAWPMDIVWIILTPDVRCLTLLCFDSGHLQRCWWRSLRTAQPWWMSFSPQFPWKPRSPWCQTQRNTSLPWDTCWHGNFCCISSIVLVPRYKLVSQLWKVIIDGAEIRTKECPVGSEPEMGKWFVQCRRWNPFWVVKSSCPFWCVQGNCCCFSLHKWNRVKIALTAFDAVGEFQNHKGF